ncbi:hypothetical protein ACTJJ0_18980 [Chitinophaga sp. 22321]|uniref:Uncharacterized protein n=1 Tax=Chitinophaga hostae TaxID=2831022 RepID=A0ABS5J077_9BACT|nr:hypothetical protein [Chitinophaga hostae]MBS0028595.1 hypothetical protein [Chitinophaga hostae]
MKSTIKGLYLSVPTPCGENWGEMTPTANGRHCSSCNKTVVDFSLSSDAEIFAVIANSKGEACGRFFDDQLQRNIAATVPSRSHVMPAMLMAAGLAVGIATNGYAEARGLEQIEMQPMQASAADTSVSGKTHNLPEIVVIGYEMKTRTYTTGAVCVTNTTEVKVVGKTLVTTLVDGKIDPITERPKKKKRFLFF